VVVAATTAVEESFTVGFYFDSLAGGFELAGLS